MVISMLSDEADTIDAETSWLALLSHVWLKPESKAMPGMYLSILEWIKSINTKNISRKLVEKVIRILSLLSS